MSKGGESSSATKSNFNSKRCDYENSLQVAKRPTSVISIPKGAIMSTVRAMLTQHCSNFNSKRCDYESPRITRHSHHHRYFNSKRCDYEVKFVILWHQKVRFQFQKVRLWDAIAFCKFTLVTFQFQKVRLWVLTAKTLNKPLPPISIPKGAIMRLFSVMLNRFCEVFQFQKVRLWVIS